jgi:hypothetical protein
MEPLGSIRYEGKRYAFASGKWSGPDSEVVAILNGLFRLSTTAGPSSAVLPLGYKCIRAAAKWAGDANPELPHFREGYPGQIH